MTKIITKTKIITTILMVLSLNILSLAAAQAKKLHWLYFYPSSQGSPEEAKPVMETFAKALETASQGQLKIKATYQNNSQQALQEIQKKSADLIIAPKDWKDKVDALKGLETFASLQVLGDSPREELFYLLGKKALKKSAAIKIYSQRSFAPGFLKKSLADFWQLPLAEKKSLKIDQVLTTYPLTVLKKIIKQQEEAYFLVDSISYQNLQSLKSPWVKEIKRQDFRLSIQAPQVLLVKKLSQKQKEVLKKALETIHQSPEGQSSLELLRIKKFTF